MGWEYNSKGGACSECGEPFEGWHRYNKTTCSPKCRKRRDRRQEAARLALPLAMFELGKIRDSLKRRERVEDFIADLKRLQAEIRDLLVLADDKESLDRMGMLADMARKRETLSNP